MTTKGAEGDGTPIHSEWGGKFDGKDYAITEDPDANMRFYEKINNRTLFMSAKKGSEVVSQGLVVVSVHGKSQDVTLTSPDAVMSVYNEKAKTKATEKRKEKGFRNKAFTTRNNPLGPRPGIEGTSPFLTRLKLSLDYTASSV